MNLGTTPRRAVVPEENLNGRWGSGSAHVPLSLRFYKGPETCETCLVTPGSRSLLGNALSGLFGNT